MWHPIVNSDAFVVYFIINIHMGKWGVTRLVLEGVYHIVKDVFYVPDLKKNFLVLDNYKRKV